MTLHPDTPVGEIATQHPLTTRVFSHHHIDLCCGGGISLRQACESRGLDPEEVLSEVLGVVEQTETESRRWDEAPIADLVQHILTSDHEPLRTELPRLEEMACKVYHVHRHVHFENNILFHRVTAA